MSAITANTPSEVYLLADHLDAVLAAGEDLMGLHVDIEGVRRSDGAAAPWEYLEGFVAEARLLELSIVSRALQARRWATEISRKLNAHDRAVSVVLDLFASGVAALEDAIAELADRAGADFDAGLHPLAYLRTRGLIPADAGTLRGARIVEATEAFLVARRIELGPLLDMTAALLDALDAVYCLFESNATRVRDERSSEDDARDDGKSHGLGQA
jgi:hypothetical protein